MRHRFSSGLSKSLREKSLRKFQQLMLSLALREDNSFCFDGISGGNNFQLMGLMSLPHRLSGSRSIKLQFKDDEIVWGAEWLQNESLKNIRVYLDQVFPSFAEKHKYIGLAFQLLFDAKSLEKLTLRQEFEKHRNSFPILTNVLSDGKMAWDPELTDLDGFILVSILCQDLSKALDAGDSSKVSSVGQFLLELEPEQILLVVRRNIGIYRLVKSNLDEHPIFSKVIDKVNNLVRT